MSEVRVVIKQFSARHWSRVPYQYEDFEPGERVIALRHESGQTIFARPHDPVSRYILEIDAFRDFTAAIPSGKTLSAGGSATFDT